MEIEELAKVLHEAGREAVEKKMTVVASLGLETPTKFLEWGEINEDAKEGRRIQARYLLALCDIQYITKHFTISELIDIKEENYDYEPNIENKYQTITEFINILIRK